VTRTITLRKTAILVAGGVLGVVAVIHYSLTLQPPSGALEMPLEILLLFQVIQNTVLLAIVVGLGLRLAQGSGLGTPLLDDWLTGKPVAARLKATLTPALLAGVALSLVILILEKALFEPGLPAALAQAADIPWWQGMLAAFYGGITEELLMRLGFFSLVAWVLNKGIRQQTGRPGSAIFWTANVVTAILFGLGHLPATAALVPLTTMIVLRALLLNGIASLVFGHLYWTRGLEAAIIAHFTGDILLHVVAAILCSQS